MKVLLRTDVDGAKELMERIKNIGKDEKNWSSYKDIDGFEHNWIQLALSEEDLMVILDCIEYAISVEEGGKFNSIYGYDFTASRWTYDAKYYLKDGKWWYDWMDKEAMPLNDWMISQMRAIIKENPGKELKDPIDC